MIQPTHTGGVVNNAKNRTKHNSINIMLFSAEERVFSAILGKKIKMIVVTESG